MQTFALPPIHRQGWPFIAVFFALAVALGFAWKPLFWVGLVATLWCCYFFRDPQRVTPTDPGVVVSPADGRVVAVNERIPPPELGMDPVPLPCIAVFMDVFSVHVNRTPTPGRVLKRRHHHGTFVNASFDKASDENERMSWLIEPDGFPGKVVLVQIAGLVARRIVPFVEEGTLLLPGERVGLIRFGSRCDIYLPHGMVPKVLVGQTCVAGETILADAVSPGPLRTGRAD